MNNNIKIGLAGYKGRMGDEILKVLHSRGITAITKGGEVGEDKTELFTNSDVVIDFTNTDGLLECLKFAKKTRVPLVSGSTPMNDDVMKQILEISKGSKICWSANMSICMAIARKLSSICGKLLTNYDCEILEKHHNKKKDAPSGTAIMLGESVAKSRNVKLEDVLVTDRNSERKCGQIGFASVRGGSIIGEHDVMFIGENDEITITHKAYNRSLFAVGAVECAIKLLQQKQNGFYRIEDLFLID